MSTNKNKFKDISKKLEELCASLKDENNELVFNKVLRGFPSSKIRTFNKPVCIVYAERINTFKDTFGKHNVPEFIESVIGFVVKGASTERYDKLAHILDLIIEKFETDPVWVNLDGIVRNSQLLGCTISVNENSDGLNTIAVINLQHHVYK